MSRPFGVALLIAGCDERGAHLFFADPSGTCVKYLAKAIGSATEVAQQQLQEEFRKDMGIEEATVLAVKILKQVMEDKIDATNAQVATITLSDGFKMFSEDHLALLLARA